MLKIGDFSKLSRISIRMLRHYDEIHLLKPAEIDDFTGYRYYSESQLQLATRIQALKDMGFALSVIVEILKQYEDKEQMEHFLEIKYAELKDQQEKTKQQMQLLSTMLEHMRKEETMTEYNVISKEIPSRYVATVRNKIPAYDKEGMLWQELRETLMPEQIEFDTPCNATAVFYDEGYVESNPDVEVQITVKGEHADVGNVVFKKEPPVTVASAVYKGSYEQITFVYQAVANWVKENGYQFSGAMFCIYHVSPAQTTNPDEYVTEVCFPVVK